MIFVKEIMFCFLLDGFQVDRKFIGSFLSEAEIVLGKFESEKCNQVG